MRRRPLEQGHREPMFVCLLFIVVCTTIYASAGAQGNLRSAPKAIDLKDPGQLADALLFDPFESKRPAGTTVSPDRSVAARPTASGSDAGLDAAPVAAMSVAGGGAPELASVEVAAANPPRQPTVNATPSPTKSAQKAAVKKTGTGTLTATGSPAVGPKLLLSNKLLLIGAGGIAVATVAVTVPVVVNDNSTERPRSPLTP